MAAGTRQHRARGDADLYLAKLVEATLALLDILGPLLDQAVSVLQHISVGFQPRVELDDTWRAAVR